jgi:hypothetical protein
MSDSSNSFLKWIGGILATIIAGFVLWKLTNSNNRVTETPQKPADAYTEPKHAPEKKAHVTISTFNIKTPINIGESSTADFVVTNDGDEATTGCHLIWDLPGLNNSRNSESFDLAAGESKSISLISNSVPDKGDITTTAQVDCSNCSTEKVERHLVVQMMMNSNSVHLKQ